MERIKCIGGDFWYKKKHFTLDEVKNLMYADADKFTIPELIGLSFNDFTVAKEKVLTFLLQKFYFEIFISICIKTKDLLRDEFFDMKMKNDDFSVTFASCHIYRGAFINIQPTLHISSGRSYHEISITFFDRKKNYIVNTKRFNEKTLLVLLLKDVSGLNVKKKTVRQEIDIFKDLYHTRNRDIHLLKNFISKNLMYDINNSIPFKFIFNNFDFIENLKRLFSQAEMSNKENLSPCLSMLRENKRENASLGQRFYRYTCMQAIAYNVLCRNHALYND